MNSSSSPQVAVFTKSIEHPHIKTRLAKEIGVKAARACYLQTLARTIQVVSSTQQGIIYVEGTLNSTDWLQDLPHKRQIQGDLGERMLACFEDGVKIVLGGDCPVLTKDYLIDALESLQTHDLVFGPVEDGGYFLVGMNGPHPEIFTNMQWSQNSVLDNTLMRAQESELKVKTLPMLWDIDTKQDYERWLHLTSTVQ